MVLNDLSLSQNTRPEEIKTALNGKLGRVLPEGTYKVIVRNFSGDVRARADGKVSFQAMILLDSEGRKAALQNKGEIEAMGFKVSNSGDINAN
jgi:hypothetical protein